MATSPNYAWAEPDNSSLVKNGASDIRTLGDAIDTSVWNVGYGQAGKNKFINGNFAIWQRGTSFTIPTSYTADRWILGNVGNTGATTQESFTAGAAPVAGYESQYFARTNITGVAGAANFTTFNQRIEDVRTFAGQTVTISYWAKADAAKSVSLEFQQFFGSGGSANVNTSAGKQALTTSWARYSATLTIPSISGKTLVGTTYLDFRFFLSAGSDFNARTGSLGTQSIIFDVWGVQVEYGSKATPFQTASGGSPQAELAMCQRYYYRLTYATSANREGSGGNISTTQANVNFAFPVTMRIIPTALEQSGNAGDYSVTTSGVHTVCSVVPNFGFATQSSATPGFTVASGLISGDSAIFRNVNTNAFFGWSAEL